MLSAILDAGIEKDFLKSLDAEVSGLDRLATLGLGPAIRYSAV